MNLTRRAAAPPEAAAAYVLHWVPGYVTSTGCGSWELQDAAAYETGAPGYASPVLDAPRDEPEAGLALWAAGQLGYPVDLERSSATISTFTLRPFSVHAGAEPVYHVRAAACGARG